MFLNSKELQGNEFYLFCFYTVVWFVHENPRAQKNSQGFSRQFQEDLIKTRIQLCARRYNHVLKGVHFPLAVSVFPLFPAPHIGSVQKLRNAPNGGGWGGQEVRVTRRYVSVYFGAIPKRKCVAQWGDGARKSQFSRYVISGHSLNTDHLCLKTKGKTDLT